MLKLLLSQKDVDLRPLVATMVGESKDSFVVAFMRWEFGLVLFYVRLRS